MDKYEINYIFNSEKDINDILINVLKKEIKKYIQMICKSDRSDDTYLFLDGDMNYFDI